MAYIQKNNPFPKTGCGRRRFEQMTPFKCWEGYERVPGTKEFSKGSCRKKTPNKLRKTTRGKDRTFRTPEEGAGMTAKGVRDYKRENPGSKLQTAVTGKVKPGSKAAGRRKSFCARSKSWTGERGRAARRRWKC